MKKYFVKLAIIIWLCQSPILGRCQFSLGINKPAKIKAAQTSLKICKVLSTQIVIPQQESNWCYAATTQMVLQFYEKPIPSQCEIVKSLLEVNTACQDSCKSNNNNGLNSVIPCSKQINWITFFKKYDGLGETIISNIDEDKIISQLDQCNPVIALFHNGKGEDACNSSHAVVITGYFKERRGWFRKDKLYFLVLDPKKECQGCKYFIQYNGEFQSAENINTIFASENTKIITFK
jgi:Peptidase_C39 like family